jgi:hypothetical protein
MGFGEMVVAIVLITCVTQTLKEFARRKAPKKAQDAMLQELRSLREEVRALRQQNTDMLLGLDSSVDRMERRLGRLEERAALADSTGRRDDGALAVRR